MDGEMLYMVIADGWWNMGCGSYVDFVGIFHTKDRAEDVIKQQPEGIRKSCSVVPVIVGEVYPMKIVEYEINGITHKRSNEYASGFRLGGYAE